MWPLYYCGPFTNAPFVEGGFHDKKWRTRTGVQYKYTKGTGIGEWYNPNTVISEEGKGLSITAMGNSRWIEFTDVDPSITVKRGGDD